MPELTKRRIAAAIGAVCILSVALGFVATAGAIGENVAQCDGIEALGRINNAPLAVDDEVWTSPGEPLEIDVTANDRDFDGDDITVTDVLSAGIGVASLDDGLVSYAPPIDFEGFDTFLYLVTDGNCGNHRASVRVQISADPPPPDEAKPDPPVLGIATFTG